MGDDEKLACLEREIRMRRKVYPRWVELGKMKEKDAAREIATMEEIAKDYRHELEI